MVRQGDGVVITTSLYTGINGVSGGVDYAASKHVIVGLTNSAALNFAKQNIRVARSCPATSKHR